jgi:hypothetical protein
MPRIENPLPPVVSPDGYPVPYRWIIEPDPCVGSPRIREVPQEEPIPEIKYIPEEEPIRQPDAVPEPELVP